MSAIRKQTRNPDDASIPTTSVKDMRAEEQTETILPLQGRIR